MAATTVVKVRAINVAADADVFDCTASGCVR